MKEKKKTKKEDKTFEEIEKEIFGEECQDPESIERFDKEDKEAICRYIG